MKKSLIFALNIVDDYRNEWIVFVFETHRNERVKFFNESKIIVFFS